MDELLVITLADNGKRIIISASTIEAVEELDEGCQLLLCWKESPVVVQESFDEIYNKIKLGI